MSPSMQKKERRKEERISASNIPGNLRKLSVLLPSEKEVPAEIVDASLHGFGFNFWLITSEIFLHKKVTLHAFNIDKPLYAVIRYVQETDSKIKVGVEFEHTTGYKSYRAVFRRISTRVKVHD